MFRVLLYKLFGPASLPAPGQHRTLCAASDHVSEVGMQLARWALRLQSMTLPLNHGAPLYIPEQVSYGWCICIWYRGSDKVFLLLHIFKLREEDKCREAIAALKTLVRVPRPDQQQSPVAWSLSMKKHLACISA